jgi:hypothetical protein
MKKIVSIVLLGTIVLSSGAFAYNLKINNTSSKDLVVNVFNGKTTNIGAGDSPTITIPSWDNNVSINYQGKFSPQGFLQIQRSATYDVVSSQPQVCANGRANLKTVLESGLDKNSYLLSTTTGTCSLDGGNTCKIAPNSDDQADVVLNISGADCA